MYNTFFILADDPLLYPFIETTFQEFIGQSAEESNTNRAIKCSVSQFLHVKANDKEETLPEQVQEEIKLSINSKKISVSNKICNQNAGKTITAGEMYDDYYKSKFKGSKAIIELKPKVSSIPKLIISEKKLNEDEMELINDNEEMDYNQEESVSGDKIEEKIKTVLEIKKQQEIENKVKKVKQHNFEIEEMKEIKPKAPRQRRGRKGNNFNKEYVKLTEPMNSFAETTKVQKNKRKERVIANQNIPIINVQQSFQNVMSDSLDTIEEQDYTINSIEKDIEPKIEVPVKRRSQRNLTNKRISPS